MNRKNLIDYMLFATRYEDLKECLADNKKMAALWHNVAIEMIEDKQEQQAFINNIPSLSELQESKYSQVLQIIGGYYGTIIKKL